MTPPVQPQICRVVLTGGPCAGKTTVQSVLTDVFTNLGWKVYRVSEVATFLLTGGVDFSLLDAQDAKLFQANLLRTMLNVEQTYFDLAQAHLRVGRNVIVICDRGAMDPSVYVERKEWESILSGDGLLEVQLRDNRYDCVIHMRSAAVGAESFYTTKGHSCRSEPVEVARELCNNVLTAWMGHPYLNIIDNSTGFGEKVQRTVAAVMQRCGLQDPTLPGTTNRIKWRVKVGEVNVTFRDFNVEHVILSSSLGEARLRRRGYDGSFVYTLSLRMVAEDGQVIEQRRNVSIREYEALLLQVDPNFVPLQKLRRCFIWKDRYFHLDYFIHPFNNLVLLETHLPYQIEKEEGGSDWWNSVIPSFIKVEEDVTKSLNYTLRHLCRKQEQ